MNTNYEACHCGILKFMEHSYGMLMLGFWVVTTCVLVGRYQCFFRNILSLLSSEDRGSMFLRNGIYLQVHVAL